MKLNIKKIIIVVLVLLALLLIYKAIKIIFFTKNTLSAKEKYTYSVLVKDNKIRKRDLKNIPIGYYIEDGISTSYNKKYKYIGYKDIDSLYKALLYGEVGAIIIDDNFKNMVEKDESFNYQTILIDTYQYTKKLSNVSKNVDITNDQFIIYISGIDTYGDISETSRSDVNILAVINPLAKRILLISIPRDYYINMPSKNKKDKLTHISIYGIDETIESIESLLNIDINYYIKVNFNSFIDVVDMIGGIDVNSSKSFTSKDGYNYNIGHNKLDGKAALSFVRERYAFADGDRTRGFNQEEVIKSLISEFSTTKVLLKYDSFLEKLSNKVETNMKESEIISLIKLQLKSSAKWNISTYNLDGENSLEYTYTYPKEKLYVMIPDDDMVKHVKEKIENLGD